MIPRFFGQYLLEKRLVTSEQLLKAIKYQDQSRKRLGDVAIECGYMTEAQVRDYCKAQLTGYKQPKVIEFRAELPKTPVGKILRRELRDKKA